MAGNFRAYYSMRRQALGSRSGPISRQRYTALALRANRTRIGRRRSVSRGGRRRPNDSLLRLVARLTNNRYGVNL